MSREFTPDMALNDQAADQAYGQAPAGRDALVLSRRALLFQVAPALVVSEIALSGCMGGGADPQPDTASGDAISQVPLDYPAQQSGEIETIAAADKIRLTGISIYHEVRNGVDPDSRRVDSNIGLVTYTNAAARSTAVYVGPSYYLGFDRHNRMLTSQHSGVVYNYGGKESDQAAPTPSGLMVQSVLLLDPAASLPNRVTLKQLDTWSSQGQFHPNSITYYNLGDNGGATVFYERVNDPASPIQKVGTDSVPWNVQEKTSDYHQDPVDYVVINVQATRQALAES